MTSEPVVGVVLGRQVVGKITLIYICLPFPSPTPQSQLTGTSSYYRFRCHYPLITYTTVSAHRTFDLLPVSMSLPLIPNAISCAILVI